MDRRGFLRTGGAAAVAGTAAIPARAEMPAAPAIVAGARELTLASRRGVDWLAAGAERLARRIEIATGGRYRIAATAADGDADLAYGHAHEMSRRHPAFAIFAGLPLRQGLDAAAHDAWLTVGGGQMLWDDLAAGFGFKPLVAGHTGPSAGVWAGKRLDRASDFDGAKVYAEGVAADVLGALGAVAVAVVPDELDAALADGRLAAGERLGPPPAAPLAGRLYGPGLHPAGTVLSLAIGKTAWDAMSAADQAIFEACAAQEHQVSLAEAKANALIAAQMDDPAGPPLRLSWSAEVAAALEAAAADVVARIAVTDDAARRIHDSHQAFRRLVGEPATA